MASKFKNHITVKLITKEMAEAIVKDPEIYNRISDDNCPPSSDFVMPDMEYIGGFIDGKLVSVYMETDLVHFQVLKVYRRYARELFKKSIKKGVKIVEIPVLYRSVINFVRKTGFTLESIIKSGYQKNGINYDIHRLIKWDS